MNEMLSYIRTRDGGVPTAEDPLRAQASDLRADVSELRVEMAKLRAEMAWLRVDSKFNLLVAVNVATVAVLSSVVIAAIRI